MCSMHYNNNCHVSRASTMDQSVSLLSIAMDNRPYQGIVCMGYEGMMRSPLLSLYVLCLGPTAHYLQYTSPLTLLYVWSD